MNNGTIHDNIAKDGAVWSSGKVVIKGGKIYNNTSSHMGGGIASSGTLEMYGGSIYNNNASIGGGIATGYYSGTDSILTIAGGNIYNNNATNSGGGLYLNPNTIYSNTNGIIENNTPDNVYRAS